MNWFSRVAGTAALAMVSLLAACGGGSGSGTANIRLLNASPAYASLDFYLNSGSGVALQSSAVTYGTAGNYVSAATSGVTTEVTPNGSTSALSTVGRTLSKGVNYTVVAYGWQGAMKTALLQENTAAAANGQTTLTVLNTAVDAGNLDVYLTGPNDALDSATPVATNVAGGGIFGTTTVTSGPYRLRITGTGNTADLRLDVSGLTLSSTQVATMIITPGPSGVLVNALLAVQQGSVTAFANNQSRARIVASVSGTGASVSAYLAGAPLLVAGASPAIGDYAVVTAGSYVPTLSINGTVVNAPNLPLAAGTDYTLLVWGDAAAPQFTLVTEDSRLPVVSTNAKLRLVHAVTHLAGPLALTANYSPVANNTAQGTASAYTEVAAGSELIQVTSSAQALYPPAAQVLPPTLLAKGVYTMYMLGDANVAAPIGVLRRER